MSYRKHNVRFLRYCPGDRSGSPSTLPTAVALSLLARDRHTCESLKIAGVPTRSIPHTGECGSTCVWYNYGRKVGS